MAGRAAATPILRSPPFPGIAPAAAAVSAAGPGGGGSIDRDALFAAIRAARVGGSFWALPPPAGVTVVLVARTRREARVSLAALGPAERARPLVLHPHSAAFDPWPLLDAGVPILAPGDHELAALATIAGAPLRPTASGPHMTAQGTAARLTDATRYRDPFTGEPIDILAAIERLAAWRRILDDNAAIAVAHGMAWWKRAAIARFLWADRRPLHFVRSPRRAVALADRAGGAIAAWSTRMSPGLIAAAARAGVPLVRIEDGFVRSVGLGSDLFPPFSIVADRRGIHYDPGHPSDLEHLLATAAFPPGLVRRAEALMATMVARGISKYGAATPHAFPDRRRDRALVLVAGQVEDDMSVRLGGGGVAGNLDLLRRARAAEPDAEIWFRPHPDVDAGHRVGGVRDDDALAHVDRVVRGGGMAALLGEVDRVHVLTSLTGFEALMRGRDVVTHGVPFYAGWGLTRDLGPVPARRGRRLTLPELVAGVLLLYPRYLDPLTGLPCEAETLVDRFGAQTAPKPSWLTLARRVQGRLMRARR